MRIQCPLELEASRPEPGVAVVSGDVRDFVQRHPDTALWVVVIAATPASVFELHHSAMEPLLSARPALVEALSRALAARQAELSASSVSGEDAMRDLGRAAALMRRIQHFFRINTH